MPDLALFAGLVDLAREDLGGEVVFATDDFFAEKENLVRVEPAVWEAERFTERGKWMDGWESRRRRGPGHDWAIVKLGVRGVVRGVDIDTSYFLGNQPAWGALEGSDDDDWTEATWRPLVEQVALAPGTHNVFAAQGGGPVRWLRLNAWPDGGIARLRVFGEPAPRPPAGTFDLAALVHGGRALACSDMFFGAMQNLLLPGDAPNMGGGWETRRRRGPGHDWVIVRLAAPGRIDRVVIDTRHFKGNYPDRCELWAIRAGDATPWDLQRREDWVRLIGPEKLAADRAFSFELGGEGPFTHIRLEVAPDGGVSRLRVFGRAEVPAEPEGPTLDDLGEPTVVARSDHDSETVRADVDRPARWLDDADEDDARAALLRVCHSDAWVEEVLANRPYRRREALHATARAAWWRLDTDQWRVAFAAHPRLGDRAALAQRFGHSAREQAGAASADAAVLEALAAANDAYFARHGFVFLLCATGLTAPTMLAALRRRIDNPTDVELRIAAAEHEAITALRLDRLGEPARSP